MQWIKKKKEKWRLKIVNFANCIISGNQSKKEEDYRYISYFLPAMCNIFNFFFFDFCSFCFLFKGYPGYSS